MNALNRCNRSALKDGVRLIILNDLEFMVPTCSLDPSLTGFVSSNVLTCPSRAPGDIPPSPPTTTPDLVSQTYPADTVTVVTHTSPGGQGDWVSQTSVYWQRSPVCPASHSQLKDPSVLVHVPPNWQGSANRFSR